ncbi:PREDICTED: pathogenesis-related protein PR-1 type-like [Ipomoea nil]|uniref:pathogenesis-related protein PR-1 type-like n=1 Tax=Ipomoea nil TaxID=35883 RepID=UPI00090168F0|nr:PREDICTED: pathogenesis-related protein PR-1 type-like [Ipomoea nil]
MVVSKVSSFWFACIICIFVVVITPCCNAQNSPQDYLAVHNAARQAVGVGPMTWDNNVAAVAQSYANKRAGDCKLIHSGDRRYGENLAWGSGAFMTGRRAVELWVDEKKWYNYATNSCNAPPGESCGHYTQVVWRSSTKVGCARIQCRNNLGYFVICNYSPPGNYVGQRPY